MPPTDLPAIEQQLRQFILDHVVEGPYDGEDPLADGVVDSLGAEQLVEYIEESYGVTLDDEEISYENFETLAILAGLVASKR